MTEPPFWSRFFAATNVDPETAIEQFRFDDPNPASCILDCDHCMPGDGCGGLVGDCASTPRNRHAAWGTFLIRPAPALSVLKGRGFRRISLRMPICLVVEPCDATVPLPTPERQPASGSTSFANVGMTPHGELVTRGSTTMVDVGMTPHGSDLQNVAGNPASGMLPGVAAQIRLTGVLTSQAAQAVERAVQSAVVNGEQHLVLGIHSPGGDTNASIRLHEFLRSCGVQVATHNLGQVESASVNVFAAGNPRRCVPYGHFLLHSATRALSVANRHFEMTESFLAQEMALLRHDDSVTAKLLAEATGLDESVLAEILRESAVWDADEAVRRGLASEMASACFNIAKPILDIIG